MAEFTKIVEVLRNNFIQENTLLHQFLYSVYGDIEKAKNLIEFHYNLRFKNPKFFQSRDPNEPGIQTALNES